MDLVNNTINAFRKDYRKDFLDFLDEYSTLLGKKGDYFKQKIFKRAHDNLLGYNEPIYDTKDMSKINGFGPGIIKLLDELVSTGSVEVFENEKKRPAYVLSEIYGVGPKKAQELVNKGITSIDKLRTSLEENPKILNDVQKKGLQYYEDILERIPRSEIELYKNIFQKSFDSIKEDDSKFEIVGSYRRGSQSSGDIDVIMTSNNRKVFVNFMDDLLKQNIIVEVLSRGPTKSLVITKLDDNSKARRVDFLYSEPKEYAFATLYFTGSKEFNTVMRGYALTQGYSLNEHGLYKKEKGKKKEDKLDDTFVDEESIFDFLGLVYKQPEERVGGIAVVSKDGTPVKMDVTKDENVKTMKNVSEKPAKKNRTRKVKAELSEEEKEKLEYKKMKKDELRAILAGLMGLKPKKSNLKHMKDKNEIIDKIIELKSTAVTEEDASEPVEEPEEPAEETTEQEEEPAEEEPAEEAEAPAEEEPTEEEPTEEEEELAEEEPAEEEPAEEEPAEEEPAEEEEELAEEEEEPAEEEPAEQEEELAEEEEEPAEEEPAEEEPAEEEPTEEEEEPAEEEPTEEEPTEEEEEPAEEEPAEEEPTEEEPAEEEPAEQEPTEEEEELAAMEEVEKIDVKPKTMKKRGRPKGSKNKTKKLEKQDIVIEAKNKTMKTIQKEKKNTSMKSRKITMKEEQIIEMMNNFKSQGLSYLKTLNKKQLEQIILLANKQFHSYLTEKGDPTLTDNEYDIVTEYIEEKYSDTNVLKEVGAEFEKNKVTLPVNMPSMDKIKPTTNAIDVWKNKYKGPYVMSCKLDGVSGLYYTKNGERKLYTRGNGSEGQDVSHLLKYINGFPEVEDVIVRGEFIIKKTTFDEKYKNTFSNARNLVAGIVNSKKVDKKAEDVDFISYEMIEPTLKPSEQMKKMEEMGFNVVQNTTKDDVNNEYLSELLTDWRTNYEYIIDGVIVSDDKTYGRVNKNPEHSFAFKMVMSDQLVEARVVDVLWKASKNGYLKPRVQIKPVKVGGVNIEFATGFNGNFIEENKIGIGSVIQIVRSGDVIPHIKSVTTPAETPKMPDEPYTWTSTHVDIILANKEDNTDVIMKQITAFFTTIKVDGLSEGNVRRIMDAGYNTICKILAMEEKDFLNVNGFKSTMAKKIYDSIRSKVKDATLVKIMAASGKFGRGIGERKIKPIMEAFPNILDSVETNGEKIKLLKSVNGIGKENAKSFVENIPVFLEFMRQCKLTHKYQEAADKEEEDIQSKDATIIQNQENPLFGKNIVMTKVRDKEIIDKLPLYGATLENSIKKDTFALVVKSKEDASNKIKKANELGIPIMTPEEFIEKYLTNE